MPPAPSSTSGSSFAVPVSWNDLHYSVGDVHILKGLTGQAIPSRALAILGSSGAGKTTLLNALCDRLNKAAPAQLRGSIQLGDIPFDQRYRQAVGFVTQDDIISPMSTPSQALRFSVRIRRDTDAAETERRVEESLQELKLEGCRDTIVGTPGLESGLSGGERKRCNIGIELITDPKVLLLDEPTSGLDSVTSAKIVALLNEIARKGRTVIYTIHQPTAEVLEHIDDLMLMAMGKCCYHGPMREAIEYFSSIGYTCPDEHTPTDYFMTLLQDEEIAPILIEKWDAKLCSVASPHVKSVARTEQVDASDTKQFLENYVRKTGSSFLTQSRELLAREFVFMIRNKMMLFMQLISAVFFSVIVTLVFIKLGHDVTAMQDRIGLLFMITTNRTFSAAFVMLNNFPKDKAVFIREQQAGAYSPFMYMLSKSIALLPIQVLASLVECVILYFPTDLYRSADAFFYFFAVLTLLSQVSMSLGWTISALIDSYILAAGMAPLLLVPMIMTAGLLATTDRLRPYWYWLEKPSMTRHGFVLVVKNEFQYIDSVSCDVAKYGASFCSAQPTTGAGYIKQLGLDDDQDAPWAMWTSLGVLFVLFRLLLWFALHRAATSKV